MVAEVAEQRVEVGRPREHGARGPVAQVELAAEGGLAPEGPQALPRHEEPGALVLGQLLPSLVDRVEEGTSCLPGLGLVHEEREPGG